MLRYKLFEPTGYMLAIGSFLFSLILFYNDTDAFLGSIAAALLAAGLFWLSYIILRFLVIAFKS